MKSILSRRQNSITIDKIAKILLYNWYEKLLSHQKDKTWFKQEIYFHKILRVTEILNIKVF